LLADEVCRRLEQGEEPASIAHSLVRRGWSLSQATAVVEAALGSAERGPSVVLQLLLAAFVLLTGIVLTTYTYTRAEPGGSYTLYWGAILVGSLMFLGSLIRAAAMVFARASRPR
jgi:hypothetical protein